MARVIALQHARYQDGRTGVLFERTKVKRPQPDGTVAPLWLGVAEVEDEAVLDRFYRNRPEQFEVVEDEARAPQTSPPSAEDRPRKKSRKVTDDEPVALPVAGE